MKTKTVCLLFLLSLGLVACRITSPDKPFEPDYISLERPAYFPTINNIPASNRLSKQGIALGRHLFYERRIGGRRAFDSMISCASCHVQAHGFDAGSNNPHLRRTAHVPLPLVNIAYNTRGLGWNSRLEYPQGTLEKFIAETLADSNEFASTPKDIESNLASIDIYPPMFKAAFGTSTITFDRICIALAQFVRSMQSANSKFDRYVRGEASLSDEEMRGYVLFTTEEGADCFHCHGGSGNMLFTSYENLINGLDAPQNFKDAHDRSGITGKASDKGAYRVPTLRNIAHTAPYMHDGRFATLDEVIDQYSENLQYSPHISPLMHHVKEGGVQLTPNEKAALKAFLNTLSDEDFLRNPEYSDPFVQDTLLP